MSEELKACPFCGKEPILTEDKRVYDANSHGCPMSAGWTPLEKWNTRPIEDALQFKLENVLASLYAMDCNSLDRVSVSYAVAKLCDEELDRSGRLLGMVRDMAYKKLAS